MVLSGDDILKFQELYQRELGIEITEKDAYEKGIKLLRLMSIIYKPMTEEEQTSIQKRREETLILLANRVAY